MYPTCVSSKLCEFILKLFTALVANLLRETYPGPCDKERDKGPTAQ